MSFLVKKNELKSNKYYRKQKLDIDEVLDEEDAKQDLGLNKSIYGDDEGYILVARKAEDHYIVRFITLENLLINKVLNLKFSSAASGSGIINVKEEIDIDNLDNIKKINKQKLDLDEMSDNYVKLDIIDIINELKLQYESNGKKGIRLNDKYTKSKVKTTKLKKEPKKEEPKKEDLFEIFTKSANIDKRMEELQDLIDGDSFDGIDPAEGKKLIEYQDELLTLKIGKLKKDPDYSAEDIIDELHSFPRGKPYSSFINFEKILRQEDLLKQDEEFEKLDDDFIEKLESIRGLGGGISGETANPNLFKSPLTIVKKLDLDYDPKELKKNFDFKIDSKMLKAAADALK